MTKNTAYKICRLKDGIPRTLFHSTAAGTRMMPVGTWLYATDRQVRDGSGNRWYRSGFHTFTSWETCMKYLRRFKRRHDLCIVEVEVGGTVWMKPQSKGQVQLSTQMKILGIKITVPQLDQEDENK